MSATVDIRQAQARLTPLERLELLCDPGTVQVLRSRVTSPRLGARAVAGDGVVGATGAVAGQPIACYAQDGSYLGGSLGERHADTIVRVLELAERARMPVVAFVESGGARMQEGTAALAGYGRIFRHTVALTGVVPQISIVSGSSAGGGAYSPALTDLILMTEDAAMFLTGPGVVRDALGEEVDAATLGGPRVHERNGVCHLVERDEPAAALRARQLLSYLPPAAGVAPPRAEPSAPAAPDPGAFVPSEPRRAYDVRDALGGIIDAGSLLELCPRWARNVVTALARLDGRPVGIVANQPHYLGGVLDAEGSEKAARFVSFCDSFGVPLIAVVDTPGFMPGSRQERAGVIRHGASLVRAFAAARVPKLTVVLRKSYGGAYITMNSRDLGADLVLSWPDAELGIMSARAAVSITARRELGAAEDPERELQRLASDYADEHLAADAAAAAGFVDEIVAPLETRARLAWALETLCRGAGGVILAGKRLLITGVLTKDSIAFHAAERAQREGATVLLTSFGRMRRLTERAAARLPEPVDVLELDVNSPADLEALSAELRERWDGVDGVLHAIAFAPEDALGGRFLTAPADSAAEAFRTSAFSLKALAVALEQLMGSGGSIVGLDFDATVAWPIYDWMGVAKAALESVCRYLARDLGPRGVRVNLVAAGPLGTVAARGIPGFEGLASLWREQAPLGWDIEDPAPVADTICFLLSDYARAISGEIVHVDGGFHAIGAPA